MAAVVAAPILVITRSDDRNRFHAYIEEILLGEGYPWLARLDLAETPLARTAIEPARVVILTSVDLSADESEALASYVADGGALLALRPPPALAQALGLVPHSPVRFDGQTRLRGMNDRWVHFRPDHPLVAHLAARDLQFHGRADLYEWPGEAAAVVAWLAPFLGQASAHPAIVATPRGAGKAVLFTFDLAASTVLFHQGRRDQSSTGPAADYDADAMFKPNDFFVGHLDERLKTIPQADIHQDAFVRLIEWLVGRPPLPRVWYFPGGAPAVAFFNGDGDSMAADDLRNVIAQVDRFGVPFTTYVMTDNYPVLEPAWEAELRARGHGFGQHAWAGPMPTLETMRRQLREELGAFAERYGHRAVSYRGHSVIWVGWTEMAKYLLENGVRLDTNFAPGKYFREGYVNASGLPVKFMDEDGQVVDVYEQVTMSTDDGWMTDKVYFPAYSIEECIAASRRQLDEAATAYHTVYHPYFHPIHTRPSYLHTQPWLTAMLHYCRQLGVPCVRDEEWIAFNDARRSMHLEAYAGSESSLSFTLRAERAIAGATIVLPIERAGGDGITIRLDGEPVPGRSAQLEGQEQIVVATDFAAGQAHRYEIERRT